MRPPTHQFETGSLSSWNSGAQTHVSWTWLLGARVDAPSQALPCFAVLQSISPNKRSGGGRSEVLWLLRRALGLLAICMSVLKHKFCLWDCWAFCPHAGQLPGPTGIPRHSGRARTNSEEGSTHCCVLFWELPSHFIQA